VDACFGLPEAVLDALYAPARAGRGCARGGRLGGGAYAYGLEALAAARTSAAHAHPPAADTEARAPFDPYHYRIIYQTFHAIRTSRGRWRATRAPPCCRSSTRASARGARW
jgi:hypothetical protein